ncbi:unnamed protein product [Rodentolepis nana]|uniref:Uncharacterized protein n=1 Tax=Rodentolepis nana TaxID=102285 RepID=A0A0R3TMA9_RODNA|nr:unnamed protein product [Rodentolepis nana]
MSEASRLLSLAFRPLGLDIESGGSSPFQLDIESELDTESGGSALSLELDTESGGSSPFPPVGYIEGMWVECMIKNQMGLLHFLLLHMVGLLRFLLESDGSSPFPPVGFTSGGSSPFPPVGYRSDGSSPFPHVGYIWWVFSVSSCYIEYMWVECILSICEGVLMVECILPIFEGVLPGNPSVRSLNSATASILGQSLRLSNGFDSWPVGYVESATVHCFSFVRASSNGFDSWPVGSKSATVHCFSFLRVGNGFDSWPVGYIGECQLFSFVRALSSLHLDCILPIFEGVLPGNPSVGYVESATVHCFSFVRASSNGFDSWPVGCFSFVRALISLPCTLRSVSPIISCVRALISLHLEVCILF